MRGSTLLVFFSLVLTPASGGTLAQTSGQGTTGNKTVADTRPPNFPRLFPNPTHNNGYEEWVQAADLIQYNPDVDTATLPGATLTFKRRVLAAPPVARALLLLREGLKKPVSSPRQDFDENTLLPEMAPFRKLARLLRTEQYVDFASGHVDDAIDSLRVGLAFGYSIQTDSLISGLVGLAVDTIVLEEFAHHFEQLSVYQCDRVLQMVTDFLKAENPAIRLLALEKSYVLKMLEARRSDADAVLNLLENNVDPGTASPEYADFQKLQEHLAGQPGEVNSLLTDAEARISAVYDQAIANLGLPLAERKPYVPDKSTTPAAILARLLSVDPRNISDRYTSDQAKLRLLGVHVLIQRYRWEHNMLPNSLADLHADELVTDPFTDEQIVYARTGDRYTLYSQGPLKRDEAGQQPSKEHVPVKLIP